VRNGRRCLNPAAVFFIVCSLLLLGFAGEWILAMRYEMRMLESGWSVWDTEANVVAMVEGHWQIGMSLDDADDLMNLLNRLDHEAKPAGK
jgi:hypothetical protein